MQSTLRVILEVLRAAQYAPKSITEVPEKYLGSLESRSVHTGGAMLTEQRRYLGSLESSSVLTTSILQIGRRRCLGSLQQLEEKRASKKTIALNKSTAADEELAFR